MLDFLQKQDTALFLLINHLPHNFFLDTFFGVITFSGYLGIAWIVISLLLYFRNKKKYRRLLFLIFLTDLISIIIVEWILKNMIARPRPSVSIAEAIVPFDFYHSFSFPSGHATIAFAAAYILGRQYKKLKWLYYFLAFLISFSRIYLGKHYSSDVVGGAVIGFLIGFGSYKLVNNFTPKPTKSQL